MGLASRLLSMARDERVILVAIGCATFGLETEDALKDGTLEMLLNHPNYSIREVATKILCDRAINDPDTTDYLLYGITRPDYGERMRCLRALALLTGQTLGLDGLAKMNNEKAYRALVRSLELSLEDSEPPDLSNAHWDEYYLRDMAERFCLMFSLELINKYGATMLVKAQFVERWLAKQDWGEGPKSGVVVEIVNRIKHLKRGLRALEKAGLMDKDSSRRRIRELPDLIMEIEEEIVAEQPAEQQSRRTREHSAEERRLRRQHREAMVLNDGTRPLGRGDIIERDHGSPT
ncbi:hypothetical protein ACCO45_001258 [Purpureocillium lilacinum]|uniref:Uncharacterized protein n=1 Tax=Purpureocillium lilacinum TaxID=33203 RepID=A0ACC4E7Y2_PURLI